MPRLIALASPHGWRRLAQLSAEQRRLVLEAAVRLAWGAAFTRLRSFDSIIRSGSVPLTHARSAEPDAIAQAVRRAAAAMPFRAMCLEQGLACQAMLRARGIDARLNYGAAVVDRLEAHVWVTVGEQVVIGAEEAARFTSVARFPD